MTTCNHYDVVIVGGGMVGASLAVALKNTPLKVAVIEPYPLAGAKSDTTPGSYQPSYDARSTAISWGSRLICQRLGIWEKLAQHVTPIENIHVSDRGRFGATRMHALEYGVSALGYVVPNDWIGMTLTDALMALENVDLISPARVLSISRTAQASHIKLADDGLNGAERHLPALTADLVVIADGGRSEICQKLGIDMRVMPYGQHALVANVTTSRHHGYVAYERFAESGPMAMLPLGESELNDRRCALVWTLPEQEIGAVMALSEGDFIRRLQDCFGYRLGNIIRVGERFHYPLQLSQANEQVRSGVVVVGNAAHALHPVAGQGYNLALRGVVALAESLRKGVVRGESVGALSVLQSYLSQRLADQDKTILFSDKVTRLFGSGNTGVGIFRDLGLIGLDLLPVAKGVFARQAMGLGGVEAKLS